MAQHSTDYFDTLIQPSPDCPVGEGVPPPRPGTVAALQYEKLMAAPYARTSDDLLFEIHSERNGTPDSAREEARAAFFSRGQPCLRSSPLVKTYGWGIHHDSEGRIAIYGAETAQYRDLSERAGVSKLAGMRSQRVPEG